MDIYTLSPHVDMAIIRGAPTQARKPHVSTNHDLIMRIGPQYETWRSERYVRGPQVNRVFECPNNRAMSTVCTGIDREATRWHT